MKRRQFITLLGVAATWPLAAGAQQATMPVIGFLGAASPQSYAHVVTAFRQGLKEVGYIDGQNILIEYRWAQDEMNRLPALATELVERQVALIAASSTPAAFAAKAATKALPIVFEIGFDPVEIGLIASLNRPGANLTGVTNSGVEVAPKQLELLHELVPSATGIALLINPTNRSLAERLVQDTRAAARPTSVAYRGTAPAMNDLVGGHVDFLCEQSVSVAEQIKAGAVKAYVVSANQRLAALPDIPSAKEAGIDYQMSIWAGVFAPKGTPKETIAKLAAALDKALDDSSVRRRLSELGGSIPAKQERTPVSFARLVKAEIARWSPILKAASVTTN